MDLLELQSMKIPFWSPRYAVTSGPLKLTKTNVALGSAWQDKYYRSVKRNVRYLAELLSSEGVCVIKW